MNAFNVWSIIKIMTGPNNFMKMRKTSSKISHMTKVRLPIAAADSILPVI